MATQLRGLLVDDEGVPYRQDDSIFGPQQTKKWGEELMQKRRDAAIAKFWNPDSLRSNGVRMKDGKPMGFLAPSKLPAGGGEWDAFSGIMAGAKNAAAVQGKNMAVTGLASRPSMRAFGGASGTYPPNVVDANDGWEPEEVRTAKLRTLQEQGNAMTDARLRGEQERDPGYQDYMRQRNDQRDVASFDRRAPIYHRGREMERGEDIQDFRDRAFEQGTNPWLREEREHQESLQRERDSMNALGRMFGAMRPETAELFENNPEMLDEFGRRVSGGPSPSARAGGGSGVGDQEPVENQAAASPIGGYEGARSAAELPPVVRAEIEQLLRQNRYAVNEKNIMAVFGRMQQQQQQ